MKLKKGVSQLEQPSCTFRYYRSKERPRILLEGIKKVLLNFLNFDGLGEAFAHEKQDRFTKGASTAHAATRGWTVPTEVVTSVARSPAARAQAIDLSHFAVILVCRKSGLCTKGPERVRG